MCVHAQVHMNVKTLGVQSIRCPRKLELQAARCGCCELNAAHSALNLSDVQKNVSPSSGSCGVLWDTESVSGRGIPAVSLSVRNALHCRKLSFLRATSVSYPQRLLLPSSQVTGRFCTNSSCASPASPSRPNLSIKTHLVGRDGSMIKSLVFQRTWFKCPAPTGLLTTTYNSSSR